MAELRGAGEVVAGIVPGQPLHEFTKQFWYTCDDWERDQAQTKIVIAEESGEIPGRQGEEPWKSKFQALREEALAYAARVANPACLNWVQVTWIWY